MKPVVTIVGILLIVFGIGALSYRYFTYTTDEKIAQIGNVELTAKTEKTVELSPVLAGLSLAAGIVLVIVGMRKQ